MGHKKLIRFAELNSFENVLQFPVNMAGNWKTFFQNDQPITLELACGKGEYAVGLGELYPNRNFIGVDLKGNRIWVGAKKAREKKLENVAFLRIQIDQISEYFGPGEVDEIWITFPDPQLRTSKAKKRLTHPKFLRLYQQFLKPAGKIHLKTDSPVLYDFTRLVINVYGCKLHEAIDDVHSGEKIQPELLIKTYYESLDIAESNKVHYLSFSLPENFPSKDKDEELKKILKEVKETMEKETEFPEELNEDDFYSSDGITALTEDYLLNRGYCCGLGCKNCPYEYKNVPEPNRSILLMKKKNRLL